MALKDSFVREVLPYLMTTWCFLTVLLNIILGICTLYLINKQLSFTLVARSFTIQFVVIDVICDLFVLIPAAIVSTTLTWILTDLGCQVYGVGTIFVYLVTFSILSLRCLERVIRIRSPGLHRKLFGSHRRLAILMISVWFVDLLISGIPLSGWTVISYDYYHSGCYPNLENNLYHLIVVTFLGIGLAIILFIVSHIVIFNSVNAQSNQTRIEPIVIKKEENSEENLPRTSSQNWIHESDESYDSNNSVNDGFSKREKNKMWFGIGSPHNRNEKNNDSYDYSNGKPRNNDSKLSGSHSKQKSGHKANDNDKKEEIREQLAMKHTLFSVLHSVFTHFGICLFMIIFWMPYFIVAICRTIDASVFRGYYSLALCFILLTYTVRPFAHYVRLYRLIKTKKRNRVQWHREIKQDKIIAKQTIPPKFKTKSQDDRYMNNGDDYDEESSIGFNSDSSDNSEKRDEKQHRVQKFNLRGISASYEKTSKDKNTRRKSEIKEKKKQRKSKTRRRKKKRDNNIKGLPVLSKRNRGCDSDSELEWTEETEWSEESGIEFGEYVDETVPNTNSQNNSTKNDFKRSSDSSEGVDGISMMELPKKEDERGMRASDPIHDLDLSDKGRFDSEEGSVKIALVTSRINLTVNKKRNDAMAIHERDDNNQIKENKNKPNQNESKTKHIKKGDSETTENNMYSDSTRHHEDDNKFMGPKAEEFDKSKGDALSKHKMNNQNGTWANKSRNIEMSPSKHEQKLLIDQSRRNSDVQRASPSEVQGSQDTFPSSKRRKTYDTLFTESEPANIAVTYSNGRKNTKNDHSVYLESNVNDENSNSITIDQRTAHHTREAKNRDINKNENQYNSTTIHPNFSHLLDEEKNKNVTKNAKMSSNSEKSYQNGKKNMDQNRKVKNSNQIVTSEKGVKVPKSETVQTGNYYNAKKVSHALNASEARVSKDRNTVDKDQENERAIDEKKDQHNKYNVYKQADAAKNNQDNQMKIKTQKKQKSDYDHSERNYIPDDKKTADASKLMVDNKYHLPKRHINNKNNDTRDISSAEKENRTYMNNPENLASSSKVEFQSFTSDNYQMSNEKISSEDKRKLSHENLKAHSSAKDKDSKIVHKDGFQNIPEHRNKNHTKIDSRDRFKEESYETRNKQACSNSNENMIRHNSSIENHTESHFFEQPNQISKKKGSISDENGNAKTIVNHKSLHDRPHCHTNARGSIDPTGLVLNIDNLPAQHYAKESSEAQKVTNPTKFSSGSLSDNKTVKDPLTQEKKSNANLPSVTIQNENNSGPFENDEVDLTKVFINKDDLPRQFLATKIVDIEKPSSPDDEHKEKDNLPDTQQKDKGAKDDTTKTKPATYLNKAPLKTFNIYDADEAAPVSSRSLDSKPSQNWFKVKSKVTSYVAMSTKNKFSAIHGEDNAYDRSGAREIPISHIKDDRQWKQKLADVHLL